MSYYAIHNTEDGLYISKVTDINKLLEAIADGDYGPLQFYTDIPYESDPNYWEDRPGLILIKGEIVVPKAVETVTKYEIK